MNVVERERIIIYSDFLTFHFGFFESKKVPVKESS